MVGDRQVAFPPALSGQPDMTARPMGNPVTEPGERLGKFAAGKVARESHNAMTSSRTWWRRIILGLASSSGK